MRKYLPELCPLDGLFPPAGPAGRGSTVPYRVLYQGVAREGDEEQPFAPSRAADGDARVLIPYRWYRIVQYRACLLLDARMRRGARRKTPALTSLCNVSSEASLEWLVPKGSVPYCIVHLQTRARHRKMGKTVKLCKTMDGVWPASGRCSHPVSGNGRSAALVR